MKTIFTTLLLLVHIQAFAQTVQTAYYTRKGKLTTTPSKALTITETTWNEKGDCIAFKHKTINNRIMTAYQCQDYIPVGPWVIDGKKVEIPGNLANPYVACTVENEELMNTLLPKKELITFLAKTIKYPEFAIQSNIQGKVNLVIDLDKSGNVENIRVRRSTNPLLTVEAIRVIKQLKLDTSNVTDFEGIQCYEVPITFKLN